MVEVTILPGLVGRNSDSILATRDQRLSDEFEDKLNAQVSQATPPPSKLDPDLNSLLKDYYDSLLASAQLIVNARLDRKISANPLSRLRGFDWFTPEGPDYPKNVYELAFYKNAEGAVTEVAGLNFFRWIENPLPASPSDPPHDSNPAIDLRVKAERKRVAEVTFAWTHPYKDRLLELGLEEGEELNAIISRFELNRWLNTDYGGKYHISFLFRGSQRMVVKYSGYTHLAGFDTLTDLNSPFILEESNDVLRNSPKSPKRLSPIFLLAGSGIRNYPNGLAVLGATDVAEISGRDFRRSLDLILGLSL